MIRWTYLKEHSKLIGGASIYSDFGPDGVWLANLEAGINSVSAERSKSGQAGHAVELTILTVTPVPCLGDCVLSDHLQCVNREIPGTIEQAMAWCEDTAEHWRTMVILNH